MAVTQTGGVLSDIRGKCGDVVYCRGIGGASLRSIGTWTQPDTPAQLQCRATLAAITQSWSQLLTTDQRNAWQSYAATNPRPNRWGVLSQTSGFLAFVRHNAHSYRDVEVLQFPDSPGAPPIHPPTLDIFVQRAGAIQITGELVPNVVGTYICGGEYDGHPYWQADTAAGIFYVWNFFGTWFLSDTLGNPIPPLWVIAPGPHGVGTPDPPATGIATASWSYDASLATIDTPPANYPDPPEDLTLYVYSGKPITAGRTFYARPWRHLVTLSPPAPHDPGKHWLRWTWPEHATPPPYTWPGDGTGSARAYAVAQDAASGAMSTRRIITPAFGSLEPW